MTRCVTNNTTLGLKSVEWNRTLEWNIKMTNGDENSTVPIFFEKLNIIIHAAIILSPWHSSYINPSIPGKNILQDSWCTARKGDIFHARFLHLASFLQDSCYSLTIVHAQSLQVFLVSSKKGDIFSAQNMQALLRYFPWDDHQLWSRNLNYLWSCLV